jgi:hypothetical protein
VARCFDFVTDVPGLKLPDEVAALLRDELAALEANEFPTGNYERPTDVREEMQRVRLPPACMHACVHACLRACMNAYLCA